MNREEIMEAAADPRWNGIPYALPPDPNRLLANPADYHSIDCSLYVLQVFASARQPFLPGIRTAEDIRRVSTPIRDDEVLAGDLLFFQNTYPTPGASHIGISMGRGTGLMWDAHDREARPDQAVGRTNIRTDYWVGHWMEARRYDRAVAPGPVPAPAPGTKRMRVDADALNVRESPSTSARIVGTLQEGAVVQALPYAWRWVETGVLKGWAADEFLEAT